MTVSVEELLAGTGSVVLEETAAVVGRLPTALTVAVMVAVAVVPLGIVPILQVTVLLDVPQVPCTIETEVTVRLDGNGWESTILAALPAPLLVTVVR